MTIHDDLYLNAALRFLSISHFRRRICTNTLWVLLDIYDNKIVYKYNWQLICSAKVKNYGFYLVVIQIEDFISSKGTLQSFTFTLFVLNDALSYDVFQSRVPSHFQ